MKVVILGDLHFGIKSASDVMMSHQLKFINFLFDYIKKNQIDTIIQLGDTLDGRKSCNFKVLSFVYNNFFERIQAENINYYTIIGNHDIFYRESLDVNSSELIVKNFPNIHVIGEPTTIKLGTKTIDLFPWICDENRDASLQYINESLSDYSCGHFEIGNFPIIGGSLFEGGLDYKLFKNYKRVFSGHFHNRSEKYNITYVGVPYQLTWNDVYSDNGFIVFDTESGEYQHISNPNKYYYLIEYDDTTKPISIKDYNLENSFIKIIVKNKTKPFVYNTFVNQIFSQKPADVKVIDQNLLNLQTESINQRQVDVKNTLDLINDYVDNLDYQHKNELKNIMVDLYREAEQQQNDGI